LKPKRERDRERERQEGWQKNGSKEKTFEGKREALYIWEREASC
jgi:hypothetical protein